MSRNVQAQSAVSWLSNPTISQNGTQFTAIGNTSSIIGSNTIEPNQDGWVEFTLNATVGSCVVGFGFADQSNGANQTFGNSFLNVARNGGVYNCFAQNWTQSYHEWITGCDNVGNKLKVERVGSTLKYYLNNVLKYSTPTLAGIRLVPAIVFYQGETGKSVNVTAQILSPSGGSGGSGLPEQVVQFDYDETGNRIRRKVVTVVLPRSEKDKNKEKPAEISPSEFKLKVFPNPSDGRFEVVVDAVSDKMSFEIFDASGKKVHQQPANGLNTAINISHLPTGIYILTCRDAQILRGAWKLMIQ
ncbi:MAG: T9SS type A sorting domain-containing protein [Saprospiraceae bacterium]|nr:T9SS type A sorting domain-containing protein [Saprospiraceae bacterium]